MFRLPVVVLAFIAVWQTAAPPLDRFVEASSADERLAKSALAHIAAGWQHSYTPMFVDMARLMRPPRRSAAQPAGDSPLVIDDERGAPERPGGDLPDVPDRGSPIRRRLLSFLEKQTGQRFGDDLTAWRDWMWKLPYDPHPEYATLKALLYGQIDPQMPAFFPPGVQASPARRSRLGRREGERHSSAS